jgi:hypothetical protein
MKKYILITAVIAAILSSCSKSETQMDRTIFIPDQFDAQLPAYTEWGYNAFGAKIDRLYFLSSNSISPCKVLYKDGLLKFSLRGLFNSFSINSPHTEMTLTFCFPLEQIKYYSDLVILNSKVIELSSPENTVILNKIEYSGQGRYETIDMLTVVYGILNFRRAQMLNIDDEPNRAILSGTFDFRYLNGEDEFPVHFSDGRFDMGINNDNFFVY